jgi:hypothetical protein
MTLQGKGYFIWRIPYCENGNVGAIVNLAQQSGFTHIMLKVADGAYRYNLDSQGTDLVPALVRALHDKGILVWGWHYLYGNYPINEAEIAIQRIKQLDLDGYALDVEAEYKAEGKEAAARTFMNRLRSSCPHLPVALCSYRYPSYHPQVPWEAFLEKCDYNMPQVYWEQSHNPGEQLARTVSEFQSISPFRPIIPVGSAYINGGWAPTLTDVLQFLQTAKNLSLSAANFWEWSNTRKNLPEIWNMIREFPWSPVPVPPDITQNYIQALNTKKPDSVLNLYSSSAVHVSAAKTIQGLVDIRAWYQTLLTKILPNANFNHTAFAASGNYRHLTWTASSTNGYVFNGSDTFGIYNDRIAYHYTYFSVSS